MRLFATAEKTVPNGLQYRNARHRADPEGLTKNYAGGIIPTGIRIKGNETLSGVTGKRPDGPVSTTGLG